MVSGATTVTPELSADAQDGAELDGDALAGGDDAEVAVAEGEDEVLEQPTMRAPRMAATGTLRKARREGMCVSRPCHEKPIQNGHDRSELCPCRVTCRVTIEQPR
jgi:hypothetical protein